jgi:hypothetical protein
MSGMSPYAQYQPWQDGSMMYGPDAPRARDEQQYAPYRQDPIQASIQHQHQQRRAPGMCMHRTSIPSRLHRKQLAFEDRFVCK